MVSKCTKYFLLHHFRKYCAKWYLYYRCYLPYTREYYVIANIPVYIQTLLEQHYCLNYENIIKI